MLTQAMLQSQLEGLWITNTVSWLYGYISSEHASNHSATQKNVEFQNWPTHIKYYEAVNTPVSVPCSVTVCTYWSLQ